MHAGPVFGRDVADAAWRPSAGDLTDSRIARFIRGLGIEGLEALHARAVGDPAWFWAAAADDLRLDWQHAPSQTLDAQAGIAFSKWWGGGAFNYAAACLDRRAASDPDGPAVVWEGEDGAAVRLTNADLRATVHRAAAALELEGVTEGDRVGIFLPMLPETVVIVLALGVLRAIYTPIFSGYGPGAVASRLADCEASVLVTADGFLRRGSVVRLKEAADAALPDAPTVQRVIVVRRLGERAGAVPWMSHRDRWWDEALADAAAAGATSVDVPPTDPETPYMLIYTSGTTGRPKGAVHVHGGFPIKGAQDLAHGFDLGKGDTLFWFTDLGWMMGPWAISGALLLDATLFLYEGAPDHPGPDRLWDLVARHRVTHLGLSPTLVRALMAHGTEPVSGHDLSSLRVLGSTGEPWNPDPWWWFFREIGGGRLPIVNYSGGTEVSGGIVSCALLAPIKPTSFNGPAIGMAADVVDAAGRPVRGAVGELIVRAPWPGMTRGFWRDRERYLDTYWRRWPDVWVHGDWAEIDADGYWYIHGRSDDTLKVAGKRVGPAEVESAAVAHSAVLEAAAIGIPHELKGETIVVFCVLRPGETDSPELRASIGGRVVEELGKTLRPEAVEIVRTLPKTRNGKVMRRVVRAAYLGIDPGDVSALEDPSAVEAIRGLTGARP
ncbi:MAG TPA: AMP-binding protein [Candidatus Limnocylindrales bacterium]|nr:AMP-binding protein [Candidatus Limnocylindrales bacterium]